MKWGGFGVLLLLIAVCPALAQFKGPDMRPMQRPHNQPFMLVISISGTPTASQIFPAANCNGPKLMFPGSLSANGLIDFSTVVSCGTNPAESDAYLLKLAGSTQCTLTLSTSCALTVTTCTAPWTCSGNQRLELDAPATVSGSNIVFTLFGHVP